MEGRMGHLKNVLNLSFLFFLKGDATQQNLGITYPLPIDPTWTLDL